MWCVFGDIAVVWAVPFWNNPQSCLVGSITHGVSLFPAPLSPAYCGLISAPNPTHCNPRFFLRFFTGRHDYAARWCRRQPRPRAPPSTPLTHASSHACADACRGRWRRLARPSHLGCARTLAGTRVPPPACTYARRSWSWSCDAMQGATR